MCTNCEAGTSDVRIGSENGAIASVEATTPKVFDPLRNASDMITEPNAWSYLHEKHPSTIENHPFLLAWHLPAQMLAEYATAAGRLLRLDEVESLVGFDSSDAIVCDVCKKPFVPVFRIEPRRNRTFVEIVRETGDVIKAFDIARERNVGVVRFGPYIRKPGHNWLKIESYIAACGQPWFRMPDNHLVPCNKTCIGIVFKKISKLNGEENRERGVEQEWGLTFSEITERQERFHRDRAKRERDRVAERSRKRQEADAEAARVRAEQEQLLLEKNATVDGILGIGDDDRELRIRNAAPRTGTGVKRLNQK